MDSSFWSKYEGKIMKSLFLRRTDNCKNVSYFTFLVGRNEIYYELCFSSTFLIFGKIFGKLIYGIYLSAEQSCCLRNLHYFHVNPHVCKKKHVRDHAGEAINTNKKLIWNRLKISIYC